MDSKNGHMPENCIGNDKEEDGKDEAYVHAMQICSSFIVPPVVIAAVQLGLFEIIDRNEGFISACEIAASIDTQNSNAHFVIDQMLRLLASHSLLKSSSRITKNGKVEIVYGMGAAGKFLVRDEDGVSLAPLAQLGSFHAMRDMCYYIKDAVIEGEVPYSKAQNMSLYEYLEKDHKLGQAFDKAMSDNSTMVMKRILQKYKGFEGLKSIVDVGGGIGTSLHMIISKYPSISGINFDLPHVVEKATTINEVGIKHVGGDMFVKIPKADAILLKWICHNWSDEECIRILKNCYIALPDTGKVIVIDSILSKTPETSSLAKCISQFDNIMSAQFGGKERSQQQFDALAKAAGFPTIRTRCHVYSQWVIELYK